MVVQFRTQRIGWFLLGTCIPGTILNGSVLRTFCVWALPEDLRVEEIVPIPGADTSFNTRPFESFQHMHSLYDKRIATLRMEGIGGFYRKIVPPLLQARASKRGLLEAWRK